MIFNSFPSLLVLCMLIISSSGEGPYDKVKCTYNRCIATICETNQCYEKYICERDNYRDKDYFNPVLERICRHEFYNIPDKDGFTRELYDERISQDDKYCFHYYDFLYVGFRMFFQSADRAKNPEQMRKYWCGDDRNDSDRKNDEISWDKIDWLRDRNPNSENVLF